MFGNKELIGELLDTEIVKLILGLTELNKHHFSNSNSITYLGKTYDAQTANQALEALENVAREYNLEIKRLSVDSSLDELLGNVEVKRMAVKASLNCWNLLQQVDKEMADFL